MVRSWTAAEARAQCGAACYNRSIRLASGAQLTFADVGEPQASLTVFSHPPLTCMVWHCRRPTVCASPCKCQSLWRQTKSGTWERHAMIATGVQGQPMLWFWGLSGHRYLALLLHEAALARRLRVLCVDRPGQGGSTPSPADSSVLDWPGQLAALPAHHAAQQSLGSRFWPGDVSFRSGNMRNVAIRWRLVSQRIWVLSAIIGGPSLTISSSFGVSETGSHCLLAALIVELADQLGLKDFRLVGQSCGAVFVMACALPSHPTCREPSPQPLRSRVLLTGAAYLRGPDCSKQSIAEVLQKSTSAQSHRRCCITAATLYRARCRHQ